MKIIEVDKCINCPFLTTDPNSAYGKFMCRLLDREIEDCELHMTSEYCPLKDKEAGRE